MENATKALLIAAAILVAIIIIALGLAVVRQGQEAVGNADLSEAEIEAFNSKFKPYEGSNVSTAQVNALLSTVLTHNQKETRQVIVYGAETGSSNVLQSTGATSIAQKTGSTTYHVKLEYANGLVNAIRIY